MKFWSSKFDPLAFQVNFNTFLDTENDELARVCVYIQPTDTYKA